MIPMAQQIEKLADTYRPEQLQQKYKMTQELMYLLALQQVQSETKRAQAALMASQQAQPGTVKEQLEKQAIDEKVKQIGGVLNTAEQARQQRMMQRAQGGIVGYQGGGQMGRTQTPTQPYQPTEEEIEDYIESVGTRLGRRGSRSISRDVAIRAIQAQKQEEQRQQGLGSVIGGRSRAAAPPNVPMVGTQTTQATSGQLPPLPPPPSTPTLPPGGGVMQLDPSGKPQAAPSTGGTSGATSGTSGSSLPSGTTSGSASTTGSGGAAGQGTGIGTSDPFKAERGILEGIVGQDTDAAVQKGIARARDITGRTGKAEQFERMGRETEELYDALQDPGKQRAQMRRNIFAAFGRGGGSFGQLMGNALNAISQTEAGFDNLKQLALQKQQGIEINAMELDLNAAKDENAAAIAAEQISEANKRSAREQLTGLSKSELQAKIEEGKLKFRMEDEKIKNALAKGKIVVDELYRRSVQEINQLSVIEKEITVLQTANNDLFQAALANPASRLGQLNLRAKNNDLDEKEKAELNALKKELDLVVNTLHIKHNARLDELKARKNELLERQVKTSSTEIEDLLDEELGQT